MGASALRAQGSSSVPTLEAVIATVGEGEQIAIGNDLADALSRLFPGEDFSDILGAVVPGTIDEQPVDEPPVDEDDDAGSGDEGDPVDPSTAEEILSQVLELYRARQEALSQTPPDEVAAAELLNRIGELLARIEEAAENAAEDGSVDA